LKPGIFQIVIIAMIILVLFGRGRISAMMGDFGKGINSFKKGLGDDERVAARLDPAEAASEPAADKTAG